MHSCLNQARESPGGLLLTLDGKKLMCPLLPWLSPGEATSGNALYCSFPAPVLGSLQLLQVISPFVSGTVLSSRSEMQNRSQTPSLPSSDPPGITFPVFIYCWNLSINRIFKQKAMTWHCSCPLSQRNEVPNPNPSHILCISTMTFPKLHL